MGGFAIIVIFIGLLTLLGLYLWVRQREQYALETRSQSSVIEAANRDDAAVLVTTEHGQLIHVNETFQQWLNLEGALPDLEYVARLIEPADLFFSLFNHEGRASFQLQGEWVEATSHHIPADEGLQFVIVMEGLRAGAEQDDTGGMDVAKAMRIIGDIGEQVNASLGMEPTLQVILQLLRDSIPMDGGEVTLWDANRRFLAQRGWAGDATYLLTIAEQGGGYEVGQGLPGWIAEKRQAILISDDRDDASELIAGAHYQSAVAIPLRHGDRFIGTLALYSTKPATYSRLDVALLQAVSRAVVTAIINAELYSQQEERIRDIASLQQIAEQPKEDQSAAQIYKLLNERMANLLSAEMCGVFLYDSETRTLVPQLPFHGMIDELASRMTINLAPNSPQRDIWENQQYWMSTDLTDEPLAEAIGLTPIIEVASIRNTALFPMQIGGERIGLVAISNKRDGVFTPNDIQSMRVLATQAAIVVENIRLYQEDRRIDNEILGLQEMTRAIGALSAESDIYGEIAERIGRLMNSRMSGILLFEPRNRQLVAQLPFYGVDDDLISDYAIPLPPGSVMDELWQEEDVWFSNRVQTESLVFAAGLDAVAEKTGVTKTLMATMSTAGRRIGIVQVSNKADNSDFTPYDARLLRIFATQAAAIIENARLIREVQVRAEQAEALRKVAELASAVLTTEQSFKPVLAEISRFTKSPVVFINVVDHATNTLTAYPRWTYGFELAETFVQDMNQPGYEHSVARSGRPFFSNDLRHDKRLLSGYRTAVERYGLTKAVQVPLIVGDRILGELGISNREDRDYTEDDVRTLSAVASQIAAALERLLLYEATGENLRRRMEELDAVARVSNELTLTVELDKVLAVICTEVEKATNADGSSVALLRPADEWRVADQPELSRRVGREASKFDGLSAIEYEAVARGAEPIIIPDYSETDMTAHANDVQSAAAVAILYLDQIVGVLHIYAREANRFDDRAAGFLLTMATKASLGYQNATYYTQQMERGERLRQRVDQLNRIFELGQMIQTDTNPVMMMEAIAYSVQQSVGFDVVVMTMIDEDAGVLRRTANAGYPLDAFDKTRNVILPVNQLDDILQEDYRKTADTYFFAIEESTNWYKPEMKVVSTAYEESRSIDATDKDSWRDGDLLLVRISGQGGGTLGVIALDRPYNNRRPDRQTLEVLEIFGHQAATMVENTRLFAENARSAQQESQLNLITQQIASTLELSDIAESVAGGLRSLLPLWRLTLAVFRSQGDGFDVVQAAVLPDGSLTVSQDERPELAGALKRTYDERTEYYYTRSSPEVNSYSDLRQSYRLSERASLIIPLITGGECIGVMHIASSEPDGLAAQERRNLLGRISQLISSTVQNSRLFDQALNLQALNRSVVESIQQGIVVLDNTGRIINFNEFMRDRYGWETGALRADLFSYRPTLTEFLQDDLSDVLNFGQPRERLNHTLESAAGESLVSNFYLYPLISQDEVNGVVLLVEDVTDRARLEAAIEARANQLAALTEVSTRITSSLERDEVIGVALNEMSWILPADTLSVWRRTGQVMQLEGYRGATEVKNPQDIQVRISDSAHVQQIMETQRTVALSDEDGVGVSLLPGDKNVRSWLGVPLVNQGHVVGMLVISRDEAGHYQSREEQYVAFAFGSQVAIALANADLFEQTFERTNELGTLLEAAQATSMATSIEEIFKIVADLMFTALDMEDCTIMTWDEVDNELEVQFSAMRSGEVSSLELGTTFNLKEYPARSRAMKKREVIAIVDTHDEATAPPYPLELEEMRAVGRGARLLVPLIFGEQPIGLIFLQHTSNDPESVTQQQVRLANALGAQIASAIYNARLSNETRNRFEELLTINQLSQAVSSTLTLEDMLPIIREQVPQVTRAEEIYLALYDKQTDQITFPLAVRKGEDFKIPPRQLGNDEVSYVIKRKHTLSLGADYFSLDELRRSMGIVNGEGDVKSYMGVPLVSGDEILGVLAVRNLTTSRAFNVNDDRILTTVGSQLGAAIQNARLFEQITRLADDLENLVEERTDELEEERDRLDTLYQITSELARTLDMAQLLDRALGMVSKAVGAQDGVIMLSDPATDKLFVRAALNPDNVQYDEDYGQSTHPAEGLATWLLQNGDVNDHVVVIDDLLSQDYWDPSAPGAADMRSALAVLLENNEDPMGVMVLLSVQPNNFTESHLKLLVPAANQVAASINSADLYLLIREQAERLGKMLRVETEEAQKNTAILESIADGVMLADAQGVIRLFNSAAERILKIPREQAIGQNVSRLTGIYGASAARWSHMVERWTGQDEQADNLQTEFVSEQVELGDSIVNVQLAPVSIGDQFLGTVSVFRDITKDVEASRIKSQFIENVSHEFRTPLTPIKGYTDLLLMGAGGSLTQMQEDMVKTIKENVERLTVLVNDVLNIAKADRGEQLTMQKVPLREMIPTVVEQIAQRIQNVDKALDYHVTIADNVPEIRGDREKIAQVISNIVDNAFNYTPAGGRVDVNAEVDQDERHVLITVKDTGVGIPEHFKEAAWRRFERYERHALELDVAGTGLGLSLVRELVMLHGGRVWFDSELGKGTTFYVRLPIEQPSFIVTQPIDMSKVDEIVAGD